MPAISMVGMIIPFSVTWVLYGEATYDSRLWPVMSAARVPRTRLEPGVRHCWLVQPAATTPGAQARGMGRCGQTPLPCAEATAGGGAAALPMVNVSTGQVAS